MDNNYTYTGAAISSLSSVASVIATTSAFKSQLEADTASRIANSENIVTSYELQQAQNAQIIMDINNNLGDKLSERGLAALKEASLMKAAGAETGTSGGTTDVAMQEAFMNEQMDRANIIASAKNNTKHMLQTMDTQTLSTRNQIDSVLSGGLVVNTDVGVAALSGGLGGITTTLSMMTDKDKASLYGIKPKQTKEV